MNNHEKEIYSQVYKKPYRSISNVVTIIDGCILNAADIKLHIYIDNNIIGLICEIIGPIYEKVTSEKIL